MEKEILSIFIKPYIRFQSDRVTGVQLVKFRGVLKARIDEMAPVNLN